MTLGAKAERHKPAEAITEPDDDDVDRHHHYNDNDHHGKGHHQSLL